MEQKKEMCFLNTGVGNEVIPYVETMAVPKCWECRFRYNMPCVAPCFDCQGLNETGRSYFEEMR
jgi:hypothetical protein